MVDSGIKLFEIKGLFNQFNIALPLDNNVNIFLGENGMGKTTILNCLYFVLYGNYEKLNNILFDEISITFSDDETYTINHNDITSYVEEYIYDSNSIRRRRVNPEAFFSSKEIEIIMNLYRLNPDSDELRKYYYRISDLSNMPQRLAKIELERFIIRYARRSNSGDSDYDKVIEFKEIIRTKINGNLLYFPTYRRIEEDLSSLGFDPEGMKVKDRLIQFGMSDVEKNIDKLLLEIKSVSITGFTKMTGVLLKQYLGGQLSKLEDYLVDQDKLSIALARIGDEIDSIDKDQIIELVQNNEIYMSHNIYLLNLIKNLIDSYEKQNLYDDRIKKFAAVCNNYLNGKKYIYDESNVEIGIYKDNSKRQIGIQNLSSGEKQIISVFSKLYIEDVQNCIILFDEPELSLSLNWQSMFLPDIMRSDKCATLIAVTHSPFIFDNEFDTFARDMRSCLSAVHEEN